MCTVSFVTSNDKIIITSNRDEQVLRPNAIAPHEYSIGCKKVIFPKDPKAGGTWYAIDKMGTVLVLLNGAKEKHEILDNYRKSRGLVVVDMMSSFSAIDFWYKIDLNKIEPFTLVLFQDQRLYQLRWNGFMKEEINLDANQNHIWSSTTLYPKKIREEREKWFFDYLSSKPNVTEKEMYDFHRYTKDENLENGLVINRNDFLKTLSITQTIIDKHDVVMRYSDLVNQREFENSFTFMQNSNP